MVKTYVIVGASIRSLAMYAEPMVKDFADCTKIIGIFDPNSLRSEMVLKTAGLSCPAYTDFDKMIAELKPDRAIIATIDSTHHEYAIKCLDSGIDVIVEKPMTTDAEKCKAILDAEKQTGKKVIVTFNVRFTPFAGAIKQAMADGAVGDVLNVDFEYMLDTRHGADYYRRWHRRKENSGGLLVHKSTHHFDLINWWIEDDPAEVMAFGSRRFYGPTRSERGERCSECDYSRTCEFYFDVCEHDLYRTLYKECEAVDGYYRDRCVFSEDIDIEDTMSVNVRYSNGAMLSYSLITHCPFEGWKVSINGTKGRLEAAEYHTGPYAGGPTYDFDLFDRSGKKINYAVPKATGDHGGGDDRLREMVFRGAIIDPLGRQAGSVDGAASVLMGIAANKSIAEHKNVVVSDLLQLDMYRD